MIEDLRLHGSVGPVDFFAFVSGTESFNTYFYQEEPSGIRFFSRGNEFSLSENGISYKGTGGSFCEYMFGVEKPVKDMTKGDILNRLIMFGAFLDKNERVVFTNETEGEETYSRLFLLGHAVKNYFFMISSDGESDHRIRQREIVKSVGKFLKRTDLLSEDRDTDLISSFYADLNEKRSILFMFKLIHRGNQEYYRTLQEYYSENKELFPEKERMIRDIVTRNSIDQYQQERMKIDVMYRHSENRVVVDEYRDILIRGVVQETFHSSEDAKLQRLRTLSIRNNIPVVLFDTLDDLLLKDRERQESTEHHYLNDARAILENLFFKDSSLKQHIIKEDIVRLIKVKHRAYTQNDRGFEQILLDIGKACDELARKTDDFGVFEEFSSIVTYFDRYDNVHALISQLAFMKNIELKEESLRSLIGNKNEFDELDPSLFRHIFIKDMMANKYITSYGKRKIKILQKAIEAVQLGNATFKDVLNDLNKVIDEEKLYYEIRAAMKERMRSFLPGFELKEVRRKLRTDIARELSNKGLADRIPARLFEKVFIDLRKESIYLNQILPKIIQNQDSKLREDFIENSGLDRFYIESIEQEAFEEEELDMTLLETIREGKSLSGIGGGERIRTAE